MTEPMMTPGGQGGGGRGVGFRRMGFRGEKEERNGANDDVVGMTAWNQEVENGAREGRRGGGGGFQVGGQAGRGRVDSKRPRPMTISFLTHQPRTCLPSTYQPTAIAPSAPRGKPEPILNCCNCICIEYG